MQSRTSFCREMRNMKDDSPGNASMQICYCFKEFVVLSKAKKLTVLLSGKRLDNMVCRLQTMLETIQDFDHKASKRLYVILKNITSPVFLLSCVWGILQFDYLVFHCTFLQTHIHHLCGSYVHLICSAKTPDVGVLFTPQRPAGRSFFLMPTPQSYIALCLPVSQSTVSTQFLSLTLLIQTLTWKCGSASNDYEP